MANSTQALQHFQTTPLPVLKDEIRRGEHDDELDTLFGTALADEIRQMVDTPPPAVLGDRPLVVLLPGIMGSTLASAQSEIGMIWINPLAFAAGRLNLLRLDEQGQRDVSDVGIAPVGLVVTTYLPMQLHLQHWGGCDVELFPFDWRRTPDQAADLLHGFLDLLFRREGRRAILVCHSMGGLVARSYCTRYPAAAQRHVTQVVMLGTPNYGSCEAVRNITVGGSIVQLVQRLNRENDPLGVARSAPGLYTMVPAPPAVYPADAPLPYPFDTDFDPYDAPAYQIKGIRPAHLEAARQHYHALSPQPLPVPVTIIAGYDVPTCVGVVKQQPRNDAVTFDFETRTSRDGDGTVPLGSVTALPGAECFYVPQGKHGDLPLYGNVRRAVIALARNEAPNLPRAHRGAVLAPEAHTETATVPEAPLPGTLSLPELDAIAERLRSGSATPNDLAALTKLV